MIGSTLLVGAAGASAQRIGVLRGTVLDDVDDQPIPGAEVVLEALQRSSVTDSAGRFVIRGVPLGRTAVLIRRLGYLPLRTLFAFTGDSTEYDFTLVKSAQTLPEVEVRTDAPAAPKLSLFEEHRKLGFGRFLPQDVFEKNAHRQMSEIIAAIPGPRVMRGSTNSAWVASSRGSGSLMRGAFSPMEFDRRRGAGAACYSTVMLDGVFVFQGLPGEALFDINSITPSSVAGLEFYSGAASMPAKYQGSRRDCGLVVVWTK